MTALAAILLAPFALLTAFFTMELFAGLKRPRNLDPGPARASAAIVVPAHDEAKIIRSTLTALGDAIDERMRILVIADNCTDSTAVNAREAGFEVLERNDPDRRGKGFALVFAADHLRPNPPDIFVVLDADCRIDDRSLRALVDSAAISGRPSQAINLLRPDRSASPLVQLSTFAFMLKNLVRQRGLQRLAGRVHLTGTGMAMPFALFRMSRPASSSIVEDLALGLELADAGHPPVLIANACVWSSGSTEQGTLAQRRRWEGGYLRTAIRWGTREALHGLAHGKSRAVFSGLDLMVPPLALFAALNVAAILVAGAMILVSSGNWWPVITQVALVALALVALLAVWVREGRKYISLGVLARLPLYVLWKLPMYLGLARRGSPTEWLRTGR